MNVGDIIFVKHTPGDFYKVIELNKNHTAPYKIQHCTKTGAIISKDILKDTWKDWHSYNWVVYLSSLTLQLSEADKKYEKIIIKMKQLDQKFKSKKENKVNEYPF
jgi:hypothetical protein